MHSPFSLHQYQLGNNTKTHSLSRFQAIGLLILKHVKELACAIVYKSRPQETFGERERKSFVYSGINYSAVQKWTKTSPI